MAEFVIPPPPPQPWVDLKTGQPTREFYLFILALLTAIGQGQGGVSLFSLTALVETSRQPREDQLNVLVDQLMIAVGTARNLQPQVDGLVQRLSADEAALFGGRKFSDDALDRRLQQLEAVVYGSRDQSGLVDQIKPTLDSLAALVLTGRH